MSGKIERETVSLVCLACEKTADSHEIIDSSYDRYVSLPPGWLVFQGCDQDAREEDYACSESCARKLLEL